MTSVAVTAAAADGAVVTASSADVFETESLADVAVIEVAYAVSSGNCPEMALRWQSEWR